MEYKRGDTVKVHGIVYTFLRRNKFHNYMAVLQGDINGKSYIEHSFRMSELTPVEVTNKSMVGVLDKEY